MVKSMEDFSESVIEKLIIVTLIGIVFFSTLYVGGYLDSLNNVLKMMIILLVFFILYYVGKEQLHVLMGYFIIVGSYMLIIFIIGIGTGDGYMPVLGWTTNIFGLFTSVLFARSGVNKDNWWLILSSIIMLIILHISGIMYYFDSLLGGIL